MLREAQIAVELFLPLRQAFLEFPTNKINMHKELQACQLCAQTCDRRLSKTGLISIA